MGKASKAFAWNNETEGSLRQWVGDFLDLLDGAGFVRTDDTGQVDPETVPHGGTTAGQYAYAVYRFDDALQATRPIFFRIDLCTSAATNHALRLTVGKGTDGAGNITGVLRPQVGLGIATHARWGTTDSYTHLAAAGEGWAGFLGFTDMPSTAGSSVPRSLVRYFLIERTRAADGSPTGDGLMVLTANDLLTSSGSAPSLTTVGYEPSVMTINYDTGAYLEQPVPVIAPHSINGTALGPSTSLAAGSIGPAFPWDLLAPGIPPWRSCAVVSLPAGDMPAGVFTTNLCGRNGDFLAVPPSDTHNRWGLTLQPAGTSATFSRWFGVGIRWED